MNRKEIAIIHFINEYEVCKNDGTDLKISLDDAYFINEMLKIIKETDVEELVYNLMSCTNELDTIKGDIEDIAYSLKDIMLSD